MFYKDGHKVWQCKCDGVEWAHKIVPHEPYGIHNVFNLAYCGCGYPVDAHHTDCTNFVLSTNPIYMFGTKGRKAERCETCRAFKHAHVVPVPSVHAPTPYQEKNIAEVMKETGCSRDDAISAINRYSGSVVHAIREIKEFTKTTDEPKKCDDDPPEKKPDDDLDAKIAVLEEQVKHWMDLHTSSIVAHDKKVEELDKAKRRIKRLKRTIDSTVADCDMLESVNNATEALLEAEHTKVQALEKDLAQLGELAKVRGQWLSEAKAEIGKLSDEHHEEKHLLMHKVSELKDKIAELESQHRELQVAHTSCRGLNAQLDALQAEKERILTTASEKTDQEFNERRKLTLKIKNLEFFVIELEREIEELETEREESRKVIKSWARAEEDWISKTKELKEKIVSLEFLIEALKGEEAKTKADMHNYRERIAKMDQQIQKHTAEDTERRDANAANATRLMKQRDDAIETIRKHERTIETLTEENKRLCTHVKELEDWQNKAISGHRNLMMDIRWLPPVPGTDNIAWSKPHPYVSDADNNRAGFCKTCHNGEARHREEGPPCPGYEPQCSSCHYTAGFIVICKHCPRFGWAHSSPAPAPVVPSCSSSEIPSVGIIDATKPHEFVLGTYGKNGCACGYDKSRHNNGCPNFKAMIGVNAGYHGKGKAIICKNCQGFDHAHKKTEDQKVDDALESVFEIANAPSTRSKKPTSLWSKRK